MLSKFLDSYIFDLLLYFRRKVDAFKGRGTESVRRSSRDTKAVPTPEFNAQGDASLQVL